MSPTETEAVMIFTLPSNEKERLDMASYPYLVYILEVEFL